MKKLTRISNELKEWIIKTLHSGVQPELLVDALIKKGFDPKFSYTLLFQLIRNQSIDKHDQEESLPYLYEIPALGKKGNIIHTSDRDIKVTMRIETPFILFLDNFLSIQECDELIALSTKRLKRSQVINSATGERIIASGRTSEGTEYAIGENLLIQKIEKRIQEVTDFPVDHGESLQVLHYNQGEEYKSHYDFFPDNKIDPTIGVQRVCTLLMYLNDVHEGGETIFPKIDLKVSPKKGAALYFHYGNEKGQTDRLSLHSSVPVLTGEKWVATKWIRQGRIY
ncbi:2OG-Fe(II) oxygenase [Niallia sp. Krafla_26]|uniref:2OG-Fe(II) oxygenase n=1 Tax=Niallia sp. Krafla_26 TaxID=3064703 RepID=UPI003D17CAAE